MNLPRTDYYQALGIAPDADEREVKRAYFKQVRLHPPERHPEEFQRVREAYEVLSNPTSRRGYDDLRRAGAVDAGDDVAHLLAEGAQAMERGDHLGARAALGRVVAAQPDLRFARDLLGMACLHAGLAAEALAHFAQLVSVEPTSAVYHLHAAYAQLALRHPQDALSSLREARRRDPSDPRVLVAIADAHVALDELEPALAALEEAVQLDGEEDFQDFAFLLRRAHVQLLRGRARDADRELDRIEKILPPDEETRRWVGKRLAAVAAELFRVGRGDEAEHLLSRARTLDGGSAALRLGFPPRVEAPVAALPPASRAQLERLEREWHASKVEHGKWAPPILSAFAAALAIALVGATLSSTVIWSMAPGSYLTKLAAFALAPSLGALAVWHWARALRSPLGRFTVVHPLYLLEVRLDRVVAFSLARLREARVTHRMQNGAYHSTTVQLDFAGGAPHVVTLRGREHSVDWAQGILAARDKLLALLAAGLLDAEEGLDVLPPALVRGEERPPSPPPWMRPRVLLSATAVLGALFFVLVGVPLNRARADEAAWSRVGQWAQLVRADSLAERTAQTTLLTQGELVESARGYLVAFPDGAHARDARAAIDRAYVLFGQGRGAPALEALLADSHSDDVAPGRREATDSSLLVRCVPHSIRARWPRLVDLSVDDACAGSMQDALRVEVGQVAPSDIVSVTKDGSSRRKLIVHYSIRPPAESREDGAAVEVTFRAVLSIDGREVWRSSPRRIVWWAGGDAGLSPFAAFAVFADRVAREGFGVGGVRWAPSPELVELPVVDGDDPLQR